MTITNLTQKELLINSSIKVEQLNGEMVTTSLQVAEVFGKEHRTVLRNIENLMAQNCAVGILYHKSEYETNNRMFKMYYMDRDGFSLLAMGFTGEKALEFKLAFIDEFKRMERVIKQQELISIDSKMESIQIENLYIKDDIEALKKEITISRKQCSAIRIKVKNLALFMSKEKNITKQKATSRIYWDMYEKYMISSYTELPKIKFEEAFNYLDKHNVHLNKDQMQLDI